MSYGGGRRSWKPWRFDEECTHQFQPEPLTKSASAAEAPNLKYPIMEHLSNDQEDHPNKHKNSCKLYDEKGHPLLSLKESKWKLRQQDAQNFLIQQKLL